ncbi:macrophage migration inhibitory factor-like isoform X1 [Ptychodera flava]|uniref:macrophage migration inhibitory factor-like isoform X1 n=1 Tax=Ptychodera flava TaxID=63121 RepID=UPI003969ED94
MPHLTLYTNVSRDKIPDDFLTTTTKLMVEIIAKPEEYIMVHVIPDQVMSFGGSTKPCGNAFLTSIGNLGLQENKKITKAFMEHVKEKLGIEPTRMYITFSDAKEMNVGHNLTTFAPDK